MSNRVSALEWIEPPAGGLQTLQDSIARRNRTRFIAAGCAALALVSGTLVHDWRTTIGTSPALDAALARHTENDTDISPPFRVVDGAALELPSPSSNARIYLVSTMPEKPPPESD